MITKESKKYLLSLARQTLVDYFSVGQKIKIDNSKLSDKLLSKQAATFVTLLKQGDLRGCVGSLIAKKMMYEDVINNTLLAGFGDPRFEPLKEKEIKDVVIEISVLSEHKPYIYDNTDELLDKIKSGKHGVIVQKDFAQATFLPQVWRDIPSKNDFMNALCRKAGLDEKAWHEPDIEIFYYEIENFSEID